MCGYSQSPNSLLIYDYLTKSPLNQIIKNIYTLNKLWTNYHAY